MKSRFLIILFFLSNYLLSQTNLMDSLKLVLKNAKHDSTRCKTLTLMVENEWDDKVWPAFNDEIVKLANKNLRELSETDPARKKFKKYLADAINNRGFLESQHGDFAGALGYYKESLKIQAEIGDKVGMAASLNNLGSVYKDQGNVSLGIEYFMKSLKIQEEIGDKRGMSYSLGNLGLIYFYQQEVEKALEFYGRTLKLQQEIGETAGIGLTLNNIALVYFRQQKYKEAEEYWQKSLKVRQEINDMHGYAESLANLGALYSELGDQKKALECHEKSLKIKEEMGEKGGVAYSLNDIGEVYLKKKEFKKAVDYCERSLAISKSLQYPELIRNAALNLTAIYKASGNYRLALQNRELYILMRDSLINEETKKASIKNQLKYEYEKQAAADSIRNFEEQKVKDAQLAAQTAQIRQEKFQRYALIAGLVFVLAGLAFVVNRFRITQRQKKIIELQKERVDRAYEELHEKNTEILDSIRYAQRIQRALLPNEKYIEKNLGPKDLRN
ncbi:MAG: tetratricopeptide repeat protein [Bacteroidia bacterium]